MDTNKNLYTVVYATLLVVIVAALLAFVAASLKSRQQKNIDMEKQTSFLKAVGLGADAQSAPDKVAYIQNEFAKYIVESFTVDAAGNVSDVVKGSAEEPEAIVNSPAFRVNLKEQYDLLKKSSGEEAQSSLSLNAPWIMRRYISSLATAQVFGVLFGDISHLRMISILSMAPLLTTRARLRDLVQKSPRPLSTASSRAAASPTKVISESSKAEPRTLNTRLTPSPAHPSLPAQWARQSAPG